MAEKEENTGGIFLDYIYYIGAALLFIFIIYLVFSDNEAAPNVLGLKSCGQEYKISSAFGIAK
tara:strand:+ start:12642 stop:12830 length:189 start_codon:yes stop_codon:yes gene_type:complete